MGAVAVKRFSRQNSPDAARDVSRGHVSGRSAIAPSMTFDDGHLDVRFAIMAEAMELVFQRI